MSPDRGSSERDPRPQQVSGEEARAVPATSSSLMDASHAGTLSAGCEALFRSTETTLQWAWRVLKYAKAGPGAGPLATSARQCALEFLDRVPPHVRRGVAELLGYSSLWQAVCTRLGRPVARSTEELQHELGEDLQVLLHGAQARLGTAAALEQGLLVHLGRLRDSRRGEPGAPLELRAALDAFTHSLSELMTAASAYRRAWEAAETELSESAAWLGAGDPGFCSWMADHLSETVFAWRNAQASVRMLRELGELSQPS
ncbi:hypothetical protein BHS06_10215 [Myxococcus xanthus]|nr:hypothetical protein BHS06_10215 [Myxococcus xanthus]